MCKSFWKNFVYLFQAQGTCVTILKATARGKENEREKGNLKKIASKKAEDINQSEKHKTEREL